MYMYLTIVLSSHQYSDGIRAVVLTVCRPYNAYLSETYYSHFFVYTYSMSEFGRYFCAIYRIPLYCCMVYTTSTFAMSLCVYLVFLEFDHIPTMGSRTIEQIQQRCFN